MVEHRWFGRFKQGGCFYCLEGTVFPFNVKYSSPLSLFSRCAFRFHLVGSEIWFFFAGECWGAAEGVFPLWVLVSLQLPVLEDCAVRSSFSCTLVEKGQLVWRDWISGTSWMPFLIRKETNYYRVAHYYQPAWIKMHMIMIHSQIYCGRSP